MRTPKEVIKEEIMAVFTPFKGASKKETRQYLHKVDILANRILRALERWTEEDDSIKS